ncbi:MAG: hypothetical protein HY746_09130 [Elusimicrobia bacterium]|nr:hypothetical protein [Elusimicrobiota bacterium]
MKKDHPKTSGNVGIILLFLFVAALSVFFISCMDTSGGYSGNQGNTQGCGMPQNTQAQQTQKNRGLPAGRAKNEEDREKARQEGRSKGGEPLTRCYSSLAKCKERINKWKSEGGDIIYTWWDGNRCCIEATHYR